MKAILKSLKTVDEEAVSFITDASQLSDDSFISGGNRLFIANEAITMCKLFSQMISNAGPCVCLLAEINDLLLTLEEPTRPDFKDRPQWISLHDGTPLAKGKRKISDTRLNYTGNCSNFI